MTAVVRGVYKKGTIELLETPAGLREGPVRVVLVEEAVPRAAPRLLTFGKYHAGSLSTVQDFKDAEWRGEAEFDGLYGK